MAITTDQQLALYNGALKIVGSRKLSSLTENREPRYLLDDVWSEGGNQFGAVVNCLENALWIFATRSAALSFDPDYGADYGFKYRFELPADFVRTASVCVDEFYEEPLTRYTEEGGSLFADLSILFTKYVSKDLTYGLDYTKWPQTFIVFVETYLASKIISKLTSSGNREKEIMEKLEEAGRKARSNSAMEMPSKFPPQGLFVKARQGYWSRGNWRRGG